MIKEHRRTKQGGTRLNSLVPTLGEFFTDLELIPALNEFDKEHCIRSRIYIAPSFSEIRHILNLAQVFMFQTL
jgi:IMP and pyridine-specific 5'-nucleotidase